MATSNRDDDRSAGGRQERGNSRSGPVHGSRPAAGGAPRSGTSGSSSGGGGSSAGRDDRGRSGSARDPRSGGASRSDAPGGSRSAPDPNRQHGRSADARGTARPRPDSGTRAADARGGAPRQHAPRAGTAGQGRNGGAYAQAARPSRGGAADADGPGAWRVARPAPVVRAGQSSAPPLPDDLDPADLDPTVRSQLRSLDKAIADEVAGHLIMTAELLDEDPELAYRHAAAARDLGARVGAVREAAGIAAYRAGEWAQARTELRTARRITGDARHLPLLADCERALGKPELAVKLLDDPDAERLEPPARAELLIVAASARRDMGQSAAALLLIQRRGPEWIDRRRPSEAALRVWFVYADLLTELQRRDEAAQWFTAILRHDPTDELGTRDHMRALKLPVA